MYKWLLAAFLIIYGLAAVFGLANAVLTTIGGICAIGAGVLLVIGQG